MAEEQGQPKISAEPTSGTHPVRFLRDETAGTDFFGSHQRVAEAIALAMRDMEQPGVIGLLGPWGSGKSTIVHLLGEKLSPTHHVFTYDAWLHQSDPPRRSFLEQLRAFLVEEGLLSAEARQEEFDAVNRRVDETTTTTTPHLTRGGTLLLLALLAVPLGSRFLGVDWAKVTLHKHYLKPEAWVFPGGLLATVAPLLVASSILLLHWWRQGDATSAKSMLNLVVNRQTNTQTSRVTRTPEPTTIEFQQLFRNLLADIPKEKPRLLLVVDNLDRLPEEAAISMWDTIRSFFLGALPKTEREGGVHTPPILLPLDARGMARLHKGSDGKPDEILLRSFIDKTFDVVFHVSRPVISDWQAFVLEAMRKTFGNALVDRWRFDIIQMFAKSTSGRVTPRDLNRHVNAIAGLWLQWRDTTIAFPLVVYFALFREKLDENLLQVIANPEIDLTEHEDWERALAAIHFGVAPEDALQVLLGEDVSQAIFGVDHAKFAEFIRIKGVDRIVVELLEARDAQLALASKLGQLVSAELGRPEWRERVWAMLDRIWRRSDMGQRLLQPDLAASLLGNLLRHVGEGVRNALVTELAAKANEWGRPTMRVQGSNPEKGLEALLAVWIPHAQTMKDAPPVVLREVSTYLEIAGPLVQRFGELDLVRCALDADAIARSVANSLKQDGEERNLVGWVLLALAGGPGESGQAALFTAAVQTLQSPSADAVRLAAALEAVGRLRQLHVPATEWLAGFARQGNLRAVGERMAEHWHEGVITRVGALCILERADLPPLFAEKGTDGLFERPELAAAVDRHVRRFGSETLAAITDFAKIPRLTSFACKLVSLRLDASDLGETDPLPLLGRYEELAQLASVGRSAELLRLLEAMDHFWNAIETLDAAPVAFRVYGDLLFEPGLDQQIRARTVVSLGRLLTGRPIEWWEAQIAAGGPVIRLAQRMKEHDFRIDPPGPSLFDALSGGMSAVARPGGTQAESWFGAAHLLGDGDRAILTHGLMDALGENAEPGRLLGVVRAGGDRLLDDLGLDARPDDAIRRILVPLMELPEGLFWMVGHSERIARWLAATSSSAVTLLMGAMDGADQSDTSISNMVVELKERWQKQGRGHASQPLSTTEAGVSEAGKRA